MTGESAAQSPAASVRPTTGPAPFTIRAARPEDADGIHARICDLAVYEREPDAVTGTAEDLRTVLFGDSPAAFCHVAEVTAADGSTQIAGIALWFLTYSTWEARHGIWLEDLFVLPERRGSGIGSALLRTLAGICVERGYRRLEWTVLDWNEPSIGFYRSLGARPQSDWTTYRLSGEELESLGAVRSR